MVRLTEIVENGMGANTYTVRSVYINPSQIVMIREDSRFNTLMSEGKLNALGFDQTLKFTKVSVRGGGSGNYDITVAGRSHCFLLGLVDKVAPCRDSGYCSCNR